MPPFGNGITSLHEVITAHVNKPSHTAASQAAENPEKTISVMLDKRKAENIAENRPNYTQVCCRGYTVLWSPVHCTPGKQRGKGFPRKSWKVFVINEIDSQS